MRKDFFFMNEPLLFNNISTTKKSQENFNPYENPYESVEDYLKKSFQQQVKFKKENFQKKVEYLQQSKYFEEVAPLKFLEKYFKNEILVYKEKEGYFKVLDIDYYKFLYTNNTYLYYNKFFHDRPKLKLLKTLKFIVIDIDNIILSFYKKFIGYLIRIKLPPQYILISGEGIHLIYKVKDFEVYKRFKRAIFTVNACLHKHFIYKFKDFYKQLFKIDIRSLNSPYRLPGAQVKFANLHSRLFKITCTKEEYSVLEIAKWLNLKESIKILEKRKEEREEPKRIFKNTFKKHSNKVNLKVLTLPNGFGHKNEKNAYTWLLSKKEEIPVGYRYMFMFSLSVMAYKYRIPLKQLEKDLKDIFNYFNIRDTEKLKENELQKALTGYDIKFVKTKWETMEMWIGNITRETKRNYRTREEHLKICNYIRKINKESKQKKVKELKRKGYKISQIARILNISRQHVYTLLKEP